MVELSYGGDPALYGGRLQPPAGDVGDVEGNRPGGAAGMGERPPASTLHQVAKSWRSWAEALINASTHTNNPNFAEEAKYELHLGGVR